MLPTVFCLGEAMLELTRSPDGATRLGFGGDTLNTALYLARLGVPTAYVTALGKDPFSDDLVATWNEEGIETTHVLRHPVRMPGLYAVQTDEVGEREFFYWRGESAARDFFSLPGAEPAMEAAAAAGVVYFSGISLSILNEEGRQRMIDLARRTRAAGGEVAFDPNYRPKGWPNADTARATFEALAPHISLVLPTLEDDIKLWGEVTAAEDAGRWLDLGAGSVVVKDGPNGATLATPGTEVICVPPPMRIAPVDTTGAGDSFNAGFLAAYLAGGTDRSEAALAGHALAGTVIRHRGAIIPRADMPAQPRS